MSMSANKLSIFFKQRLEKVYSRSEDQFLESIILVFEEKTLKINAAGADDSIHFQIIDNDNLRIDLLTNVSRTDPWTDIIGKEFVYGWVAVNHQGYLDSLMISFEDIFPKIIFNVVGSSIHTGIINFQGNQANFMECRNE